ncbi:MAG TPA: multiheme c-type cytochrome [Pyrinomonadaceae bacterium]|nr:multiheme c-type cytochrome [Pyrinomonadaceae bacterium]
MNQRVRQSLLLALAIALCLLAVAVVMFEPLSVNGQVNASVARWNPRRVPADTVFLGDQACNECHKKYVANYAPTGMSMAMENIATSKVLGDNPQLSMRNGPYSYTIKRNGKESIYSVTDGKDTITMPILYAFGQGKMGQTYMVERDGKFYESLVSYYNETKALDFTIGAPRNVPASLNDAVGRVLSDREVSDCFSCHATAALNGSQLRLDKFVHGVRCESCHGPGGKHVAAIKEGEPGSRLIFNPGRLSGDELTQQFCASCHRGADEFSLLKSLEINNVRFQPYRIFHSKCYSDEKAISCIACHNPHEQVKADPAFYDSKCLACHSLKGKPAKAESKGTSCPVADKDCTSCHMPKVEVKAAHFNFTDHYIRVVRAGEKFPN